MQRGSLDLDAEEAAGLVSTGGRTQGPAAAESKCCCFLSKPSPYAPAAQNDDAMSYDVSGRLRAATAAGKADMKRRQAVRAEAVVVSADFEVPVVPKAAATLDMLLSVIARVDLFANLLPEQVSAVAGAMFRVDASRGDVLLELGEQGVHNGFNIVERGTCRLHGNEGDFKLGSADYYGAEVLSYDQPSLVRVTAMEDSTRMWSIDRPTFRSILVNIIAAKKAQYEAFLGRVPLLKNLSTREKSVISDALEPCSYADGAEIMRIGTTGDFFFVLISGSVSVTDAAGEQLATRSAGEYFGEAALLSNAPRMATITASGPCQCARLDRDAFQRIVGHAKSLAFRKYDESGVEIDGNGVDLCDPDAEQAMRTRAPAHVAAQKEIEEKDVKLGIKAFQAGKTLGMGAFGRVSLCKYNGNGKAYAIKAMTKATVIKSGQVEHVANEKNNLLACANPFIINLQATFQDSRTLYMVMDLVPGGELFSVIQNTGGLQSADTKMVTAAVLLAFEFIHERGTIYRDLKPENVLIDELGYAKLTDFGLSKAIGEGRTFTLCGTPDYVAPEIIENRGHNKAADYWALGVMLFEMIDGLPPFYIEGYEHQTFDRILKGKLHFGHRFRNAEGRQARDLIERLVCADISKRFGALKNGAVDIKSHPYFHGFDFDACWRKELRSGLKPDPHREHFDDYSSVAPVVAPPIKESAQVNFVDW